MRRKCGARPLVGRAPIGQIMSDDDRIAGQVALRQKLDELRGEHRDLDDVIERLSEAPVIDHLQLQRLKKRKLRIKDEIARLESLVVPDIIA